MSTIGIFFRHSLEIGLFFFVLGIITSVTWFILQKKKKPTEIAKIESIIFFCLGVICFIVSFIHTMGTKNNYSSKYSQNTNNLNFYTQTVSVPVETIIVDNKKTISSSTATYYTVPLEKGGKLKFSYETETSQQIECAVLTNLSEVEKFSNGKASDVTGTTRTFVPGTYHLGTSFSVEKELDSGVYYVAFRNRNWFNDAYVNIKISKVTEELR